MKALTVLFSFLWILMPVSQAQTVDEMLGKVSSAIEAGKERPAVSYFRQAIELDINRSEMYDWVDIDKNADYCEDFANELAVAFKRNRNFDKAYLFYKELLQKNPDDIGYMEACAEMQLCRGQEKDALRIYEQILAADSDNLAANIFLGNYYYLLGEQEKKKLENDYRSISSPTRMQYARYRDGLYRLFSSAYTKARESLEKVIQKFPSTEAKKTLDKIQVVEKEMNRR